MPQSQKQEFQRVVASDWRLGASMGTKRLEHLMRGPDFSEIIGLVFRSVTSVTYKRERLKKNPRFFRLVATLSCSSAEPVDLFHNSAAGYRAQYYIAPELGDLANRYAVSTLSGLITSAMQTKPKRSCPSEWAATSIADADAKLWIHQGRWLRAPAPDLKCLHVNRWRMLPSLTDKGRKRARYSQLTPRLENRIDIKGAFVSLDRELFGTPKPCRAQHIHLNGFT